MNFNPTFPCYYPRRGNAAVPRRRGKGGFEYRRRRCRPCSDRFRRTKSSNAFSAKRGSEKLGRPSASGTQIIRSVRTTDSTSLERRPKTPNYRVTIPPNRSGLAVFRARWKPRAHRRVRSSRRKSVLTGRGLKGDPREETKEKGEEEARSEVTRRERVVSERASALIILGRNSKGLAYF